MSLSIIYNNNNITQLCMIQCMRNKIITIPKSKKKREDLFGTSSPTSIKINHKEYSLDFDIHIDIDTLEVYIDKYPLQLEKCKPKIVVLIICHYS